ncbi:molybdopterin converting factor subunit 1 [Diaphorobacter aerolatus]|uniref:Molybdopterin synthase sulfur carrier subunit n=1 Tax=Diaphorobacter aerolatus TaxID=1288495 RepID=A0A7H0GN18_9BURK|nr:molybdopterin converting factor subunit 1 [Diaphorobacter aerolatus]QNP49684.1 molybdopterin converting factor subunit 1 [Diaphorobacter aerolatus]
MNQETTVRHQISVLYFASIREAMGTGSERIETGAATVGALREELIRTRGESAAAALASGRAVRTALNQVMCKADAVIHSGDEVAFFPPVTGG